jgi:hypothetical protein
MVAPSPREKEVDMIALLLAALAPLSITLPVAQDATLLPLGSTVEGELADGDEVITTDIIRERYHDAPVVAQAWTVEVESPGRHCIDLWGYGFDAYLVLRDAEGKVLAEDDDGLAGTDSRLVVDLDPQESYRLEVGALHGQRGPYELLLYGGEPEKKHTLEWTDRSIEARIRSVFLEEAWKKVEVVKSKHYLVLTDSGAGKKFGKILDTEIYKGFFQFYGLDAPKEHRPLPVYLFNTRESYMEFLVRNVGMTEAQAAATGGIAYRDYYTTSYTSPRDPTHFHECAHQIMGNLLHLNGGGSWYQEGIAEHYEDDVSHFNREAETRMLITTKQSVSLRELFAAQSMLFSAGENIKGGGGAGGMYGQAASVILFLREGKRKKQFHEFLFAMGEIPRSDLGETERVLQEVYGISIDELDAEWHEYFD